MPLMVGTFSRLGANAEQGEVTAAALIPHRIPLHFTKFYMVFLMMLPFKMRFPVYTDSHWFFTRFRKGSQGAIVFSSDWKRCVSLRYPLGFRKVFRMM